MVGRIALVGGIWGHIRPLWMKDKVQRYKGKPEMLVNKLQRIFGPKTALVQENTAEGSRNAGKNGREKIDLGRQCVRAVSYTHLDVYKRQNVHYAKPLLL
ncbi:hypothetical protein T4E_11608 [Trichinella pseudospiralis]|uniref:Uncharacterized protein n=1 Tax=Trichinella pseudospiralis TaxID=6337 RepID=A0A0V0XDY4_TRIPS|nr:hypothetical protein T4E_11608 [Trichinella pseudospiralis]